MTEPPSCCSLTPAGLAKRLEAWRRLDRARTGAAATPSGALVRYRLEPALARSLVELIEAEARCCPSLSFEAAITVQVDAPAGLRSSVVAWFVDDGPEKASTPARPPSAPDPAAVREAVRARYAAARSAPSDACAGPSESGIGPGVYGADDDGLPEEVLASSIGCANPVAVAELAEGETVLDLGSGAGLDVLLSARRVGASGKAYGLDMTDEMVERARQNQDAARIANAEFLQGHIEAIPLPDACVDVVLSNCVISLSPEKEAAFGEAYRVLRPGGRLALADVVADAEPDRGRRTDVEGWVTCLAGSLTRAQYRSALEEAGFVGVTLEERHTVGEGFASVIVRGRKPTTCAPASGPTVAPSPRRT